MTPVAPQPQRKRRTLAAAVDDAALYAYEHQLHVASMLGVGATWNLLPEIGCAQFVGHREVICPAQIIGVVKGKYWEWGWGSSNVSEARGELARKVFTFGAVHDMGVFTTERIKLQAPRDVDRLVAASKIIHRWWTSFAFPIDGMVFYAALQHDAFTLPSPAPGAIAQTLRTASKATPLTNGRRAVRSYARWRGLGRQERRDRSATRLLLPSGVTVTAQFDSRAQISSARVG